MSPGMLWIGGHHRKLERGKEGFHPASRREHGSAGTLSLDFWPPALQENTFPLLEAPVCSPVTAAPASEGSLCARV